MKTKISISIKKSFNFWIIVFLNLLITENTISQIGNYENYIAVKNNPTDQSSLVKIETDTSHNFIDKLHMLIANCQLDRKTRVQELLLDLAEYGFQESYISQLTSQHQCTISKFVEDDTLFYQNYKLKQKEFSIRNDNDTIVKLIHEMYELDQTSRKMYRISEDNNYVKLIDSLNLISIEKWLQSDLIESKRIGVKLEEKLYIMMLHSFRHIPEKRYNSLSKKLHRLVKLRKFSPLYFANIVDERLRINNSREYPQYNFLRSVKVSKEREMQIQDNRRNINAY